MARISHDSTAKQSVSHEGGPRITAVDNFVQENGLLDFDPAAIYTRGLKTPLVSKRGTRTATKYVEHRENYVNFCN